MHHTARVADLAIALASLLRVASDPWRGDRRVPRGYQRVQPLEEAEVEVLGDLVLARLAASVLITRSRRQPLTPDHAADRPGDRPRQCRACSPRCGPNGTARLSISWLVPPAWRAAPRPSGPRRTWPSGVADARWAARCRPLFYRRPLQMVRGEGAWLYDADGTAYLDAYNNVPVLGHAHPAVARAIATQQERLNVNSRYLHPNAVELAERLVASMPSGLDTCVLRQLRQRGQ